MATNQKNKRRAMSISEMASGNVYDSPQSKHRSAYSGPKRSSNGGSDSVRSSTRSVADYDRKKKVNSTYVNTVDGYGYSQKGSQDRQSFGNSGSGRRLYSASGGYTAPAKSGGIMDYAWIVYVAVLGLCLMTSMIAYGRSGGSSKGGYYYPRDLIVTNGILNQIYDEYYAGGLGSNYDASAASSGGNNVASTDGSGGGATSTDGVTGGDSDTGVLPNATTGATMGLDTGGSYESYSAATSHAQVVEQLGTALAAGDVQFAGRKLAYEDETTGTLIGYPQSVVENFVTYMVANPEKRENFVATVGGESFSAQNGEAFVIKIPLLKFTVNMGYDDTTLSISGFSDQILNAGQSATVQPLLPCMYTITVSTAGGSQSSEVEANMNEGNLQINIGVTN